MAVEARELTALQFTVGDRMRKAREVAGLDLAVMAEACGVSPQMVSKWERGSQPRNQLEVLKKWAELTSAPEAWLYGLTPMYLRDATYASDAPEPLTLPFDAREPALCVVGDR